MAHRRTTIDIYIVAERDVVDHFYTAIHVARDASIAVSENCVVVNLDVLGAGADEDSCKSRIAVNDAIPHDQVSHALVPLNSKAIVVMQGAAVHKNVVGIDIDA